MGHGSFDVNIYNRLWNSCLGWVGFMKTKPTILGGWSLRGRIGQRGWGITTRAPRRLSSRHRLSSCVPPPRWGPQTPPSQPANNVAIFCIDPSIIMEKRPSNSVHAHTLSRVSPGRGVPSVALVLQGAVVIMTGGISSHAGVSWRTTSLLGSSLPPSVS